jgi:hypothetical protein
MGIRLVEQLLVSQVGLCSMELVKLFRSLLHSSIWRSHVLIQCQTQYASVNNFIVPENKLRLVVAVFCVQIYDLKLGPM